MTIEELITSGAIRFFNPPTSDSIEDLEEIPGETASKTQIINALKALYPSPTFQTELLSAIAPDNALWIVVHSGEDIARGAIVNYEPLNLLGLIEISPTHNTGFINNFGAVESLSVERILAHEMGHAVLGLDDTTEQLDGSMDLSRNCATSDGSTLGHSYE